MLLKKREVVIWAAVMEAQFAQFVYLWKQLFIMKFVYNTAQHCPQLSLLNYLFVLFNLIFYIANIAASFHLCCIKADLLA